MASRPLRPIMVRKKPQTYLGPSQVATILEKNPFTTPDELRANMEGGYLMEYTPSIKKGNQQEETILAQYRKATGNRTAKPKFVTDNTCPRLGGIADALVGTDGGVEIKCSQRSTVYLRYKIQAVTYMYLYRRAWWDIVVATDNDIVIQRIHWKDYEQTWKTSWFPKIVLFCASVKWAKKVSPCRLESCRYPTNMTANGQ